MTGGFAYVLDVDGKFRSRINPELVEGLSIVELPTYQEHLRGLLVHHHDETHSPLAERILNNWSDFADKFVLVKPKANDLNALLGHQRRTVNELGVVTQ